jgi:hypothetical protein
MFVDPETGGVGGSAPHKLNTKIDTISPKLDAVYGNEITKLVHLVHDYIVILLKFTTRRNNDSPPPLTV